MSYGSGKWEIQVRKEFLKIKTLTENVSLYSSNASGETRETLLRTIGQYLRCVHPQTHILPTPQSRMVYNHIFLSGVIIIKILLF